MLAELGGSASAVRAHEEMFAYWASRREGGRLPGRAHIHPSHFARHLPTISLTDVLGVGVPGLEPDYRVRLAGTGLYRVYDREITGRRLHEIYGGVEEAETYWRKRLDRVVDEARPLVGCHSLAWRGAAHASILWLRLPLASDGQRVDMILGYDIMVGGSPGDLKSGIRAV